MAVMFRCLRRLQAPRRCEQPQLSARAFQNLFRLSSSPANHMCSTSTYPNFDKNHLRHHFYPEDEDRYLSSLFESTSMQQVFDVFTSIPKENLSARHSVQALASLWDIQKFIFGIGHVYDPSETLEFKNRHHYVTILKEHPVLQEIIRHVGEHRSELEDEPLAVALLCLKKLQFGMRSEPAQKIIGELLSRKTSLDLPALSRVFICMRYESIYGFTIMSQFMPLLYSKVDTMSSNQDFCLASIALRNCHFCATLAMECKFLERLNTVLEENNIVFEATTLCKIISFLFEISFLYAKIPGKDSSSERTILASDLMRKVCHLLEPRVSEMDEMNVLSLSKFLDFNHEPVNFVNAVSKRAKEFVEVDRSLDLMSTIHPKTFSQQKKLSQFLHDYLDKCTYFEQVNLLVFRILKKTHFDFELHNKYWSKVTEVLVNQEICSEVEDVSREYFDEDTATDFTDEGLSMSSGPFLKRKFLIFAHEYINIRKGTCRTYTHPEFEQTVTRLILQLFRDYDAGKTVLVPKDYAKCVSFLLSTGRRNLEIRPSFLPNLRVEDLILIQKGADLSRRNSTSVVNVLAKQSEKMLSSNMKALDYIGLAKLNLRLQTHFEFHPIFKNCIDSAASNERWNDSRVAKELLTLMISSGFYHPMALERVAKLICEFPNDVSVVVAERFLWACFIFGVEGIKGIEESARIISRNSHEMHPLPLLESVLALCFQGCLNREMVAKVFCVEFLDEVDSYIKATNFNSQTPRRLRDVFMELNRAVCVDIPEANVPWFHEKYCTEVAAVEGYRRDTYLHSEVAHVLEDVLGSGYFARKTYSPYFYRIDFLLQLNQFGQPVKVSSKPSQEKVEGTKIAIIVHRPKDFSSNQRRLKGRHVLMKRHLEIMGYRVITIDPNKWNSMHMSDQSAKNEYIEHCIFN